MEAIFDCCGVHFEEIFIQSSPRRRGIDSLFNLVCEIECLLSVSGDLDGSSF